MKPTVNNITEQIIAAEQAFITEHGFRPGKVELGKKEHQAFKRWLKKTATTMLAADRHKGLPQRVYFRGMEVVEATKAGISIQP